MEIEHVVNELSEQKLRDDENSWRTPDVSELGNVAKFTEFDEILDQMRKRCASTGEAYGLNMQVFHGVRSACDLTPHRPPRRKWSDEARHFQSNRMTQYWADQRRKTAGAPCPMPESQKPSAEAQAGSDHSCLPRTDFSTELRLFYGSPKRADETRTGD